METCTPRQKSPGQKEEITKTKLTDVKTNTRGKQGNQTENNTKGTKPKNANKKPNEVIKNMTSTNKANAKTPNPKKKKGKRHKPRTPNAKKDK